MQTTRLEAFSDGVLAIIITIMVLELKIPAGDRLADLGALAPVLLAYLLSFIYVGIYWNNHHHMLHSVGRIGGAALWANLHLLFWLSLFPFVTAWVGAYPSSALPTAIYGGVLLMAALAWTVLQSILIAEECQDSLLARAVGRDRKGKASLLIYLAAIGLAFRWPLLAQGAYAAVALLWLVPDRRIERVLAAAPD
ncbi:MAG: DUF1211 domain-containing protein [Pseudomonadota bacterium]|nr:DUF1211 domain-containing protein [Pseudomonadota bacterium]